MWRRSKPEATDEASRREFVFKDIPVGSTVFDAVLYSAVIGLMAWYEWPWSWPGRVPLLIAVLIIVPVGAYVLSTPEGHWLEGDELVEQRGRTITRMPLGDVQKVEFATGFRTPDSVRLYKQDDSQGMSLFIEPHSLPLRRELWRRLQSNPHVTRRPGELERSLRIDPNAESSSI